MKFQSVVLALGLLSTVPAYAVDTFTIDKEHSQATFQVRHLFSKTSGRFNDFGGTIRMDEKNPAASSVEFRIQAASIDTDNEKRDEHLRAEDFFDVGKHPEIVFVSEKVRKLAADQYEVAGTLTLRGVKKAIVLPVTYGGSGKDPWGHTKAGFSTEIILNRKDFGMSWNAALDNGGLMLGDEVQVTVELEALKQDPSATAN
jgi:polyisoprenoid-binding protein YceI